MSGAVFVPGYSWQPEGLSRIDTLKKHGKILDFYRRLTPSAKQVLKYRWDVWARPKQLMPPSSIVPHALGWKFWVNLAGRGCGKTRVAAEAVRTLVEKEQVKRIALVAPTYRDAVQTMIKGESGLMSVFPDNGPIKLRFVKQDAAVYFTRGQRTIATAFVYTGEEPERLRGPQHDFAWFDELGAFKYLLDVWQLFVAGHRLGSNPRAVFTTTPRSNLLKIKGLLDHPRAVTTFGTSQENRGNLAPDTIETLESIYDDTDFAAQELGGVLYLDDSGSLFKSDWLNAYRVKPELVKASGQTIVNGVPILKFVVVVDPSGSSKDSACECGIVVVGLGADNNAYLFEDLSKRTSPNEWTRIAVIASGRYQEAAIVYEKNFGDEMVGDLIRATAKDLGVKVKTVPVEAVSDKVKRAMLVSPLVQRGRFRLIGYFGQLEKQLVTWQPGTGKSPDRLDAFVWAGIHLILQQVRRDLPGGLTLF